MSNIEISPTTGSEDETGRVSGAKARLLWEGQTDPLLFLLGGRWRRRSAPCRDLPRGLLLRTGTTTGANGPNA